MSLFRILLLAFILRLTWSLVILFANAESIWMFDSYGYWYLGKNLLEHGVFSQAITPPYTLDYFRTPGYPIFLALFQILQTSNYTIIFVQIVLSVLTCYYTYQLAHIVTSNDKIASVSALLVALDVPSILYSNTIMAETFFSFTLILACYFFARFAKENKIKLIIFSAFLLGVSALIRPVALYLAPVFVIMILFLSDRGVVNKFTRLVYFIVSVSVIIAPWLIRNKQEFGKFFFTRMNGDVLLNFTASNILSIKKNVIFFDYGSAFREKVIDDFRSINGNTVGVELLKPIEFSEFAFNKSTEVISSNKSLFLKEHLKNIFYFFAKPLRSPIDMQLGNSNGFNMGRQFSVFGASSFFVRILIVMQIIFLILVYLFFFLAVYCFTKSLVAFIMKSEAAVSSEIFSSSYSLGMFLFLGMLIIYFSNFTVPPVTDARLRVPVWPFISILSSAGLYFLQNNIKWMKAYIK